MKEKKEWWENTIPAAKAKIISVWGQNTNPMYNPAKSFDGGGYFQPQGGAVVCLADGREVVALLYDYSAGAFGRRYQLLIVSPSGETIIEQWYGDGRDGLPYADLCAAVGEDYDAFYGVVSDAVHWAAHRTGGCGDGFWYDRKHPFDRC